MEIRDPRAIKALAHPLRLDLLELLGASGPATAAHCARVLGVPQANCSFHLRQLARFGFVEDAGHGQDRRERQWRVAAQRPTLRIGTGADAVVRQEVERLVIERETRAILDHLERRDTEPADWQEAAGMMAAIAVLTAEEVGDLKEQWMTLLEPYLRRDPPPSARHVRYFMAATPLPDQTREETEHVRED
ncbi:transcriptional regulator [Longispora fulva]|uniref:DNA-binding transcriptional ArsR family regulator n=1 Tax=Longispora fulva TaxID=619741 RepID=A0A8J7GLH7_9ACTN|nr:helix-turn-helix domain-containing protein [Longispora fulva]MBG6139132.1 DNA-binding transcriptional ArsR family regulator [Longispora fulva]GIG58624.1 transcriptional regulator [Longispora fulva]